MIGHKYLSAATFQFFHIPPPNGPLHVGKLSQKRSSTNFIVHALAIKPLSAYIMAVEISCFLITIRLGTRLPQLRAGGQGLYLRSLDYLGRISEAIDAKKQKE